jgi:hypothetical protein
MTARRANLYPLAGLLLACASHGTNRATTLTSAARAAPGNWVSQASTLLPSPSALGYGRLYFGGEGRALINGIRFEPRLPAALDAPSLVPLVGGIKLPPRMGGGYLFWSHSYLYHSNSFSGPLESVGSLSVPENDSVSHVTFGPDFVLVHFSFGGRIAWSPKERAFVPVPIANVVDIAMLEDGRGLLLKEPADLWVRKAGATEFERYTGPKVDVRSLRMVNSAVIVDTEELEEGFVDERTSMLIRPVRSVQNVLGPRGELVKVSARDHEYTDGRSFPADPRWTNPKTPRELAFETGVLLDDRRAVVFVADGLFAEVDVVTEQVLAWVPSEAHGSCRLLSTHNDVLAACIPQLGESLVVSGLATRSARTERRFPGAAPFIAGEAGTVLKVGTCTPKPTSLGASVCVRQKDASWRQYTLSEALVPRDRHLVWRPTREGNAVALVEGKQPGLFDAARTEFYPFSQSPSLDYGVLSNGAEVSTLPDGHWAWHGGDYVATIDGRTARLSQLYHYEGAAVSGTRRLVNDQERASLWQSTDYGQTFRPVAVGASYKPFRGLEVKQCSDVGCVIGDWYRLGYSSDVPFPASLREPTSHRPEPPMQWTWFDCRPSGPPQRILPKTPNGSDDCEGSVCQRSRLGTQRISLPLGFQDKGYINQGREVFLPPLAFGEQHPHQTDSDHDENRLVWAESSFVSKPGADIERALHAAPLSLLYRRPFEAPRLREVFIDWGAVAQSVGATELFTSIEGRLFPVLSLDGATDGVFLTKHGYQSHFGILLLPGRAPRPFAADEFIGDITSVLLGRGRTLLVGAALEGRSVVIQLSPQFPEVVSVPLVGDRPRERDVAAFGPDGQPALIRIRSASVPSAGDPAIAFTRDKHEPLAPWSTLVPGPCDDQPGYRAIIYTDGWLPVALNDDAMNVTQTMARVHWNAKRVCLEAMEAMAGSPIDDTDKKNPTSIVIQLSGKPYAFHYYFGYGTQYSQPLKCKLRKSSGME